MNNKYNGDEKLYNCQRCKQKTMAVIHGEYGNEGRCSNCGYHFREFDYFKLLNKYSGLAVIFAMILIIITSAMFSGQFGDVDRRIMDVNYRVDTVVSNTSTEIATVQSGLNTLTSTVSGLTTRINTAETSISSLTGLYTDLNVIRTNISKINENISKLWTKVNSLTDEDLITLIKRNLTITYYPNQTSDTRYCHFDFYVGENGLDIGEVKYTFYYPLTNISLIDWDGITKPQEYNWTNELCDDNYYLYWFGDNTDISATFNITWNIVDYDMNNLTKTGIKDMLQVNGVIVDTPEIWEVYK